MAWTRIHRTVSSTGQVTVKTGYSSETINLLDWSDAANDGKAAYTSAIDVPISDDMTVLMDFSADMPADTWIRIEHSIDGTTWTTAAHSGTSALATTDMTGGVDASKIAYIDDNRQAENVTGYYFVYDVETHGKARFVRFGIDDNTSSDASTTTVTWHLVHH
mgnify:CR=1 FL=1